MSSAAPSLGSLLSIHRFPVKSMMREELNSSEMGAKRLRGDRLFALSDAVRFTSI